MKKLSVTGNCGSDSSCDPIDLVLTIKRTDADASNNSFGNHIKWTLYKANQKDDEYSCENKLITGTDDTSGNNISTSYYYQSNCEATQSNVTQAKATDDEEGSYEYSGYLTNGNDHVALIENVGTGTDDTYYLVVEYENDSSANQNDEQGKTFTVELDVAPQA